jgi:hypothetical protein
VFRQSKIGPRCALAQSSAIAGKTPWAKPRAVRGAPALGVEAPAAGAAAGAPAGATARAARISYPKALSLSTIAFAS